MSDAGTFQPSSRTASLPLQVLSLGLRPYEEIWRLQKELHQELLNERGVCTLLLCQHFPVITLGTGAKATNILVPESEVARRGIELFQVERGGDVTFHGPGQMVAYPIIDLRKHRRDVAWYMRSLEESVIATAAEFDVTAHRIAGRTGVWTSAASPAAKMASIGVRISKWRAYHGLSLNVEAACLEPFQLLNPCGFSDIKMTCLEFETSAESPSLAAVEQSFLRHFKGVFGYT